MAKHLRMTIQVNRAATLYIFTLIVGIKFLVVNSHFLAATFDFTIFHPVLILKGPHLFYNLDVLL